MRIGTSAKTVQQRANLNDFGVSISLLRETSELRDMSEEQNLPRRVSGLKIRPEK